MPSATLDASLMKQVEDIVDARLAARPQRFTAEKDDQLDWAYNTLSKQSMDESFGRILTGSLWLSGASVINGTITAEKLVVNTLEAVTANTGTLNITGTLTAAAAFPAVGARLTLSSVGLKTFNSTPAETVNINTDGSGFLGIGATKISWTSAGVMTIPAATISGLTIADIGAGAIAATFTLGAGQIATATSGTRVFLNSTGIGMFAGANQTLAMSASTGAFTATGSFTIVSAATGAHIKIDSAGGLEGYSATTESDANRTFRLLTTGSGYLGTHPGKVVWSTAGAVTINGDTLIAGTVTATALNVTTLSSITANLGTVTAGSITGLTITGGTIQTAASPAARVEITSTGLKTFNATPTQTALLSTDGSGWLGTSGSISWTTAGVVSIAGTTINNSTITAAKMNVTDLSAISANLGTITAGTVTGATIQTATGTGTRVILDSAGITLKNASNVTTALLSLAGSGSGWIGTTGAIAWTSAGVVTIAGSTLSNNTITTGTMDSTLVTASEIRLTGAGIIKTGTTTTRAEMDSTGLRGYNAGGQRFNLGNDGSGWLGGTSAGTANVVWTNAGGCTISASAITTGTLTASLITTGTLSADRISGGTLNGGIVTISNISASSINTGTLDASAVTVTNLSASSITAGTIVADRISGGTLGGGYSVGSGNTITIPSGGKIVDADGSYWDGGGIVLIAPSSQGDTIEWKYSGWSANRPYGSLQSVGSSTSALLDLVAKYGNGSSTTVFADTYSFATATQATAKQEVSGVASSAEWLVTDTSAFTGMRASVGGATVLEITASNRRLSLYGFLYPGSGSGTQTTRYISDNGTYLHLNGPINIGNSTVGGSAGNWSTGSLTAEAAYVKVYIGGVLSRIPVYADG